MDAGGGSTTVTKRLMPNGREVAERTAAVSRAIWSGDMYAAPTNPRAPALLTADTSACGVAFAPPIGAWMIGCSMPIASSNVLRIGALRARRRRRADVRAD